ncbi:MAG: tetratricopeptide repeat protein [Pseudobdellovibrio sp.]
MITQITGFLILIFWFLNLFFFKMDFNPQFEPYLPPPKIIQHLTAGFNVQAADSLWLRAVQDFDYCDQQKDTGNECQGKSWLFSVLDVASTLDKKLEPVMYQSGGLALTIIISDYDGASVIFDRGVEVYPKNWQLVYAAAYHALYEEKNKLKAAKLYQMAAENGAPEWIHAMAGRLAIEGGHNEYAKKVLEDLIAQNKDENIIKRLKEKLKGIK